MTNRDFYLAVTAFQTTPCGSDRGLEEYLRALRQLCIPVATAPALSAETFLHVLQTAFTAEAASFPEAWRDLSPDEEAPGFAGFEACLIRQVVDLREMAECGSLENEYRYFGIDSPRGRRWYNFHPAAYLECAVQGMYGGWDPEDDTGRTLVPGSVAVIGDDGRLTQRKPADQDGPIEEIAAVTWEDFGEFLWYGQNYE